MQKLYAGALRKLTSPPSRILIGVAFVMSIVLGACSPTTITETITITPPPETVTITPSATPTTTPTLTLPPPYAGLENPFLWDDTLAHEDGSVIFQESCAICHVSKEDIPALGVEFGVFDYRQNLEEGPDFYFWTVSEGRPETPMPPWGSILSEEERWQVLTYIWSLGGAVGPEPVVEPEPAVEPEPVVEPEPAVEPEPVVEPEPAAEPEPVVEPEPAAEPEPVVEPEPVANPDEETPLNMWLIIGSVSGVLVIGSAIYYLVRRGG